MRHADAAGAGDVRDPLDIAGAPGAGHDCNVAQRRLPARSFRLARLLVIGAAAVRGGGGVGSCCGEGSGIERGSRPGDTLAPADRGGVLRGLRVVARGTLRGRRGHVRVRVAGHRLGERSPGSPGMDRLDILPCVGVGPTRILYAAVGAPTAIALYPPGTSLHMALLRAVLGDWSMYLVSPSRGHRARDRDIRLG